MSAEVLTDLELASVRADVFRAGPAAAENWDLLTVRLLATIELLQERNGVLETRLAAVQAQAYGIRVSGPSR